MSHNSREKRAVQPIINQHYCTSCGMHFQNDRGLKLHYRHNVSCVRGFFDDAPSFAFKKAKMHPFKFDKPSIPASVTTEEENILLDNDVEDCSTALHAASVPRTDIDNTSSENYFDDDGLLSDTDFPCVQGDKHDAVDSDVETPTGGRDDESILLDDWEKQTIENAVPASCCEFNIPLFDKEENVLIDLMTTLVKLRAPLKAYDEILRWTQRACDVGYIFRKSGTKMFPSRKFLLDKLRSRTNQQKFVPKEHELILPYSERLAKVIYFPAIEVFRSLLTCPIINKDENFMFHNPHYPDTRSRSNPFAKPEETDSVSDINTGRSFLRTYDALIKNDNDMLFPCVLGIDATHVDNGSGRLKMEPLTISHGLLKYDVRKNPSSMRILGYVDQNPCLVLPPHNTTSDYHLTDEQKRIAKNFTKACISSLEYHMQIRCILEKSGFLAMQDNGFKWHLKYQGVSIPVNFRLYVPFIIGDTKGHDTLCGHYLSRGHGVQQYCRICVCPANQSGNSKARNYEKRTPAKVNALVSCENFDELQSQSQQYLHNAFDGVRFGLHNDRGIFGACPGELLHLILLGWFKTVIKTFFEKAQPTSVSVTKYNSLCVQISHDLKRQSDRDLPVTAFLNGFSSTARFKGHEIRGCLLVMLFSMCTTRYYEIFSLPAHQKECGVGNPNHVNDWKMLLVSLLQWYEWLKQPILNKTMVKRSVKATSWLMRRMKKVAPRKSGMKHNTIKTHLVLHIAEDILDFGVPQNVNSAAAESAHIQLAKVTSKNTQKRPHSFTFQASNRFIENIAIKQSSWLCEDAHPNRVRAMTDKMSNFRRQVSVWEDNNGCHCLYLPWNEGFKKMPRNSIPIEWEDDLKEAIVQHCLPMTTNGCLSCFTEFRPDIHCKSDLPSDAGQIYRANPMYMGGPWYDHCMITWAGYSNPVPAKLRAFINFKNLQQNARIEFPESEQGMNKIEPGLYAIIESYDAMPSVDLLHRDYGAGMFEKFTLRSLNAAPQSPVLYLVHVNSIFGPTICVKDVYVDAQLGVQPTFQSNVRRQGVAAKQKKDHVSKHYQWTGNTKVLYIFLIQRQNEWAEHWHDFICTNSKRDVEESDESDNTNEVDDDYNSDH